ncbi:GNAT family N-acetyltransferase [Spiroplasma sp. DGKH1]|uniref:GNAT family N-acetyltransferase n=1 Tax=Spiroplasma sp. DGKH1 TaxID=3050074 RepID=UPI0034C6B7D8
MKRKYRQNRKIKKIFKFKGQYEATTLAQNFVRYVTDPFREEGGYDIIDVENEIYQTEITTEEGNTYTVAISTQFDYDEDSEKIKEITKYQVDNDLDFILYTIGDHHDEQETDFLESLGLVLNEQLIGMVFDLKRWKKGRKKIPPNVKFRRVNDNKRLKDFSLILKSAFGPKSWDYAFYKTLLKLNKDETICQIDLLYKNNLPAGTGNIYFEKEIAIIDDIATHQNFRHQGLAKLMIDHLLTTAWNNDYDLVGLIATPEGFNMYRKLGFRPIKLYLNEYVTRSQTNNLEQIAKKISRGKMKTLQNVNYQQLISQVGNKKCHRCQNIINDPEYLMAYRLTNDFEINVYHQNCYKLNAKDKWVIMVNQKQS